MAEKVMIGDDDGELFLGEDKPVKLHVKTPAGIPVNVAGWTTVLAVKRNETDAEALFDVTGAVEGVYDVDPVVNTQRIVFLIDSADTDDLAAGIYRHGIRRTDDGSNTVLAYGPFKLRQAVAA